MASFSHLPAELVEFIFSYLGQSQLYAVSQLSRALHALAIPFLYRHVDLMIQPGDEVPRIDWFCFNIMQNARLAAGIETLCIGTSPFDGVNNGQRWLLYDAYFKNQLMVDLAIKALENETLVAKSDYLIDAIAMREYAAYAALILLTLPNLQRLQIADLDCVSIDHGCSILRNLNPGATWNQRQASDALVGRLSSIKTASVNVDLLHGVVYPRDTSRIILDPVLNLPSLQELELSIPDAEQQRRNVPGIPQNLRRMNWQRLITKVRPTLITKLVIRHSVPAPMSLQPLFECTPQLRSFTYDIFCDHKDQDDSPPYGIDLSAICEILPRSLASLVISIEYCDTSKYAFQQPRIGANLHGFLDLTNFLELHTLEVPIPFLTGDAEFSISTDIYPLLPPNLRHLSLRTDLSHAQHAFPLDTSILPTGLSFYESEQEARFSANARMDVSYMFHAAMTIFGFATNLKSFSVWQPADASLSWFAGQIDEFTQACETKSIVGNIIYPMLLRWKKKKDWDLVKDVSMYNPLYPRGATIELLYRGDRYGVPLGLASQYHLHALSKGHVRLRG